MHDEYQFKREGYTVDDILPPIKRMLYNGSGADIAAGDAVVWDTAVSPFMTAVETYSGTIGTDGRLICGGAPAVIPDGEWGEVVLRGRVTDQKLSAGVAKGDLLMAGGGAGQLDTSDYTAATQRPVALAMEAVSGGVGDVYYFGTYSS